jgi:hypothetical protein
LGFPGPARRAAKNPKQGSGLLVENGLFTALGGHFRRLQAVQNFLVFFNPGDSTLTVVDLNKTGKPFLFQNIQQL